MLLELTLSLTLCLGSANWSLDVSPTFLVEVPYLGGRVIGRALPHLVMVVPNLSGDVRQELIAHELKHIRQWEALGPGLALAYALTGGIPFEDYLNPDGAMWLPPPGMLNCPLLRVSNHGVSVKPCWRLHR